MGRLVWPGWWLGLLLVVPRVPAAAQTAESVQRPAPVELREPYPNPSFPAAVIPFTISPEVCRNGHLPTVSLRIYNVLVQVVAIPVLPGAPPQRLEKTRLRCGEFEAVWDGKVQDGNRDAAPGIYYYQLTVDGLRYTGKMIVPGKPR
ncbi:MAG: hypothetical protein ACOY71_05770 [Gemmatimonadota bacterium]